jgi:hypothetical protein
VATNVQNATGADSAYTSIAFTALDAVYDGASSGKYGGASIITRSAAAGTDRWDVGWYVHGDSVRTYIVDASEAINVSDSWHGSFTTDNLIQSTRATNANMFQLNGTGTGATTWGLAVLSSGAFNINEVGVAFTFSISKGTPGANNTSLSVLEGAGPTLRRMTTFDPGAAGINLTAGQLVCVMV